MLHHDRIWIDSAGGPLILLPAEIAHHWQGIEPPPGTTVPDGWSWGDPDGPVCDYDRICEIDGYVGMIEVGPGFGLVLGDEPMLTTLLPTPRGGIFIRFIYGDDTDPQQRVDAIPPLPWQVTPHRLHVAAGGLILLDSALQGGHPPPGWKAEKPNDWLAIPFETGEYLVELAEAKPDPKNYMILVRLSRIPT